MRFLLFLIAVATLAGCATLRHQDPQTGLVIEYSGPAHGAAELVHATDSRPFGLAQQAMDNGMSTSLARDADGDVRFNAGYGYSLGYTSGGNVGGFIPARTNTRYVPGQGFVVDPQVGSTLPVLATPPVVTQLPPGRQTQVTTTSGGQAIVPCPKDRDPRTVAEQAACTSIDVDSLYQHRVKSKKK